MAPVQNTFSIIPNFPSAANSRNDDESTRRGNRPAMTTKQAKKAYQNATRGPKLTKAEIRRQELLEQDRIRKEAEKERNQTRAARARDRKREKEDNERAQKKKKGLPLVNPYLGFNRAVLSL
ncbi:troponin T-like protein [Microdochium nivale]|nr:troponin T-like protein [Microdochium nivale]